MKPVGGGHTGRVAVVTGGAGGIGGGIAERLQREGARVWVLDVTAPAVAGDGVGNGDGPPVVAVVADVADEQAVGAAFDTIARREGRVDYLVGCAGVFPARGFLELTSEEWQRTLQTNLTGAFLCCRAALQSMIPQRSGRIVLVSSLLARTGGIGGAAYAASKGGVLGLARSLAVEVAGDGIQVNSLSPGLTDTAQPRGHLSESELQARAATIPLRRIGTVQDVVEACMFLLGEQSSYMTGQDLRIGGGAALW